MHGLDTGAPDRCWYESAPAHVLGDGLWFSWGRAAGLPGLGRGSGTRTVPDKDPRRADRTGILRMMGDRGPILAGKPTPVKRELNTGPGRSCPPRPSSGPAADVLPDGGASAAPLGTTGESLPKAARLPDQNSTERQLLLALGGK